MNSNNSLQVRFWQEVSILTLALVILWGILLLPYAHQGAWSIFFLSVLAGTSGILLAMSFSLSSFSYYFDFLDSSLVYRKYLGLMGYFFALAYASVAVYQNPRANLNFGDITVILGATAMMILTVMALISNQKAVQLLGGKLWKNILGLGYIAYALLVIRGILLDAPLWSQWLADLSAPFTVRMFLTLLGIAVLLFRVSVPFRQKYGKIK